MCENLGRDWINMRKWMLSVWPGAKYILEAVVEGQNRAKCMDFIWKGSLYDWDRGEKGRRAGAAQCYVTATIKL